MSNTASIMDLQATIPGERLTDLANAASIAASWDVDLRPVQRDPWPDRVAAARSALHRLETELAAHPDSSPDDPRSVALQELRANPRMLRSAVAGVSEKPRDRQRLPQVVHGTDHQEPRVAAVASSYLAAVDGDVSASSFAFYVRSLQNYDSLTLQEVWSLPAFLRFCLLEMILNGANQLVVGSDTATALHVQRLSASMRTVANTDWLSLLEPLILFDSTLRQDPTGTYAKMDFETRERYRTRIAFIARHSDCTESQVAQQVLELASDGAAQHHSDPRKHQRHSHIGYYLVNGGLRKLATRVGFHPPLSYKLRQFIRLNPDDFYITGIQLVTIVFIAAAIFPLLPNYPVSLRVLIAFLLMIMPAMQCAVELVNNSITALFDPEPLPKLDFNDGIPSDCATLVVVPTLLLNDKQVREMVTELEVRFLANRDRNLHFALLTDLPDSTSKPHENDANPLVDLAVNLINNLNAKYSSMEHGGFLLLHRHRVFNVRQGVWMGWERKRGKLLDLNKLLVGEYDAFPIKAGRIDALRSVRYILTLDSDTQLPRGTAARMVGAIAHPLNQAIIDPKLRIVSEGYGILQPRIGVSVSSASRSRLAALYSGQSGFDIYTRAISDAYQDLYGEGIFTGKGIYEVSALHAVLNRRFPRNSLLSHDLIEGAYARAGLATDIELIDDYPSHYSAYTRRKHRWVRGDWQIAQWMFSKVPDESGRMVPSPISTTSRWKIFDNLRRSLVEPFTFLLFVMGWLFLPGGPLYWTVVALLLFWFPTIVQFVFGLGRAMVSRREGAVVQALTGSGNATLMALLNLCFLPHQAMLVLDAVIRSLIRRFITGERLLEWETAAQAETQGARITPVDRYLAMVPLLASCIAVIVYFFARDHFAYLIAAPVLLLWCMATALTAWLNRPPSVDGKSLTANDRQFLTCHALRIWRYFHEFGAEKHNYLIPDNVEEEGLVEAARVSPTNVGLLLNARQAACEFGFITIPEYVRLTERSLNTIDGLQKLRGHLYNWYDTQSGQPLEVNPFVSSVDSGNFVASLYTLHAGTRDLLRKPLLGRQLFTSLRTFWELMHGRSKLNGPLAKLRLPSHTATIADWLLWLDEALGIFESVTGTTGDPWWHGETHRRLEAIRHLVQGHVPWLSPKFSPLRDVPELGINSKAELLNVDDALLFAEKLEKKLTPAADVSNDPLSLASQLRAALPEAIRNLRTLSAALRSVAQRS